MRNSVNVGDAASAGGQATQ